MIKRRNRLLMTFPGLVLVSIAAGAGHAASDEFICLKSPDSASLEDMAIACYTDRGCSYVEEHKGEALRDYEQTSVAAALGREKIEGIVTSSTPIMKQIAGYGYICAPLP